MRSRKRWTLFWILIPILAVGIFLFLLVNTLIDPAIYQNVIQKSLTHYLGREVTIGRARIGLWGGVKVAFEDFRVKDHSAKFDLLRSKNLILEVKLMPLPG